MRLLDRVKEKYKNAAVEKFPAFRTGDTLSVDVKIIEGAKTRIQTYEGTCIAIRRRTDLDGAFTVRKISNGIGVERVFPFHSPAIASITLVQKGKSRRAKHYYLRDREGKSARVAIDYDRA